MAEEGEEVAVKNEDNDLQQFPSSSSSVTTQTFSGLIARFAYATRSRKGGDSPSQKSSSLQQERSQTNASIFNNKLKSSTPKRKRTEREGEHDAGATSASTPEHSPSNKKRKIRDISHLPPLVDRLDMYLDVVICGCNPGHTSALVGFHYANVHNGFWRCLHQSGFTEHVLHPTEGPTLPSKYSIGLTDLVTTPSHGFADISVQERKASVETLLCKIARFKPRVLALNSFAIWNDIVSVLEKQLKPGRDVHGKSHRISGGGGGGGNTTAIGGRNQKGKEGRGMKVEEGRTESLSRVRLEPPLDSTEYPPFKLPQVSENRTPAFLPWKFVYEDSTVHETLIMPLPGTSGANASYSLSEKVSFFKAIHDKLPAIKRGEMDTSQMGRIVVSQELTVA